MKTRTIAKQNLFPFAEVPPVIVNTLEDFTDAIDRWGVLVTPFVAARFADVCRTRIYNLIDDGTFQKLVVFGCVHVPLGQVERYIDRRDARQEERNQRESSPPSTPANGGCSSEVIFPMMLQPGGTLGSTKTTW